MLPRTGDRALGSFSGQLQTWKPGKAMLPNSSIQDQHRSHDDQSFAPDFQSSTTTCDRIAEVPDYQKARIIFFTPDPSLRTLRHRALKDGKKLLLATRGLRRGLVMLDSEKLSHDQLELASDADGFETPVLGRYVSLDQLHEEKTIVDLFVIGSLASTRQGVSPSNSDDISRLSWLILADRRILDSNTPIVSVVPDCQAVEGDSRVNDAQTGCNTQAIGLQCDFVATPERMIRKENATRPDKDSPWLDQLSDDLFHRMPPLQELKGMKLVEELMAGMKQEESPSKQEPAALSLEAQMGMDIVNKLLKGYQA